MNITLAQIARWVLRKRTSYRKRPQIFHFAAAARRVIFRVARKRRLTSLNLNIVTAFPFSFRSWSRELVGEEITRNDSPCARQATVERKKRRPRAQGTRKKKSRAKLRRCLYFPRVSLTLVFPCGSALLPPSQTPPSLSRRDLSLLHSRKYSIFQAIRSSQSHETSGILWEKCK